MQESAAGSERLPSIFHVSEARAAGLTPGRLRGRRFVRLGHGIYRRHDAVFDSLAVYAAFCAANPRAHLSHTSAASAWGMWLPPSLRQAFPVHLSSTNAHGNSSEQFNVAGHWSSLPDEELHEIGGVRIASPAWTWTQLAGGGMTLRDLVAAGDSLLQRADGPVRPRYVLGANPLTSVGELKAVIERRGRFRGKQLVLEAVSQLRHGVDSRPESILRQDLVANGWPEPEVAHRLQTRTRIRPVELAYPGQKIAIQYEGRHHAEADQLSRDIRRDAELEEIGWITVRTDRTYFSEPDCGGFYHRLRAAFARRGGGV
ncbi:hypothetical protein BJH93_14720 [Kocuria polaris]|nr:hypothetical protein [Kocuria polaris]